MEQWCDALSQSCVFNPTTRGFKKAASKEEGKSAKILCQMQRQHDMTAIYHSNKGGHQPLEEGKLLFLPY